MDGVDGPLELADGDAAQDVAAEGQPAGEVYVVPLARTTKVDFEGMTGDLAADLDTLSSGRAPVLVVTRLEPPTTSEADPEGPARLTELERPTRVKSERGWAARFGRSTPAEPTVLVEQETDPAETDSEAALQEPEVRPEDEAAAFEPVQPDRATRPAARSEVRRDSVRRLPDAPAVPAQRAGAGPLLVARVEDLVQADSRLTSEPQPVSEPLIGPLVAAARNRARLSIDVLSERTRIRPHVLECIEVDDFAACGGDFYARGHLRTLARVFGLDAQLLIDLYDDHYAKAEIEARQVFEAELASGIGGGVRAAATGPRWTLLAACVLALASVWGVARVFNDTPQELVSPVPNVVDSAGLANSEPPEAPKMTLAPLEVAATGASPQVVVRDRDGRILWAGKLAEGQRQQVIGLAPFNVTASNGTAVKVSFLGKPRGTVGDSSAAGAKEFG